MPGSARKDIVREGEVATYHVWSRCVQRAYLCGNDPYSGNNYDYRRQWIEKLLAYQAQAFAVDVGNFSILSNHKHAILRTRPDVVDTWTDEEVAWRWKLAWPEWDGADWTREPKDADIRLLLGNADQITQIRKNLSSLSWFMARWKEPIAKLANAEMETKGHFWESRFGSRLLEGDPAVLTCSIYVDMNQCKAGMSPTLEESRYSGIQRRIDAWSAAQVQESLEHFGEQARHDQELDENIMQALLADCFLSPIQPHGPLMTETAMAGRARETTHADSDRANEQSHSRRTNKRKKKPDAGTREIHHRLRQSLRDRASDNLFLPMSIGDYIRTAYWAWSKWREQTHGEVGGSREDDSSGQSLPEVVAERIDPSNWYQAIDHFEGWFFNMVGSPAALASRANQAGRNWFQGIRRCRETFP